MKYIEDKKESEWFETYLKEKTKSEEQNNENLKYITCSMEKQSNKKLESTMITFRNTIKDTSNEETITDDLKVYTSDETTLYYNDYFPNLVSSHSSVDGNYYNSPTNILSTDQLSTFLQFENDKSPFPNKDNDIVTSFEQTESILDFVTLMVL